MAILHKSHRKLLSACVDHVEYKRPGLSKMPCGYLWQNSAEQGTNRFGKSEQADDADQHF